MVNDNHHCAIFNPIVEAVVVIPQGFQYKKSNNLLNMSSGSKNVGVHSNQSLRWEEKKNGVLK